MKLSENIEIGVVGSGAMGAGIAQVAATAGHKVVIHDSSPEALSMARSNMSKTFSKLVEKNKITADEALAIQKRISFENDLIHFRHCGLVIEAIVENLDVKQKVFLQLEKIVKPDCILASNTSSLSIASIASVITDNSRVVGIHFFNPAPLMPLVEIIPGLLTSSAVTNACKDLISSWGKQCVLAKDTPGFIVNRVARSFYGESIRIYEEGIADIATIDWAMKEIGGFKMGPFELMDFIGNDINYKVTESVWEQFFYEARFKPSLTQKRLFEAKLFGRKSGRGYYNYAEGVVQPQPNKDAALGTLIFNRVIAMLINEAADSLYLRLATREDLDTAMTKGVNYPKGLLRWADDLGIAKVHETLSSLYQLYNEERYRPCLLIKHMAHEKQKFYN
ncbi:MAG TPA: 3-hydroxyacyl-CoA dehydrogenase NAD-binding domain-containing protein [Bacteroidia bacterium]|jgi:3-hydroxybutyryl-CoA dehydrogenase|nr:3-hydroxyacyl-CoA dehydrogenase NAD-binding domain-containing protein [Bacteroidia bacterium]